MDIIGLNKWIPNLKRPLVIAGPCSAETEDQVMRIANEVSQIDGVKIFRAGIWKPRTRPNSFEGVGVDALKWLQRVKKEYGMMVTCEVANAKHAELALEHDIDILWIGARTSVNPFSVQEIADAIKGTNIPVMVKNPINADLALWIGAMERIAGAGITKLAAIHRGFSTAEKGKYRNPPMWHIPIELKRRIPELPIICDPSHITGDREMVARVCQKALDVDMEGWMVETHFDPDNAWSDAAQQVTPKMLQEIIQTTQLRTEFSPDRHFEEELSELRGKIDRIDRELMEALSHRQEIVKEIAEVKIKGKVTALQLHRLDEMMRKRLELGESLGLDENFIRMVYESIHTESVRQQTNRMIDHNKSKL